MPVGYCKIPWHAASPLKCSALVVACCLLVNLRAQTQLNSALPKARYDLLGDSHYSQYNFTDLVPDYQGVDSWLEFKLTYWLDPQEKLGIYTSTIASNSFYFQTDTSTVFFDWQQYVQHGLGLQYYPFFQKNARRYNPLFGLRLFALGGLRWYYRGQNTESQISGYEAKDLHLGLDYYYDNIFSEDRHVLIAWTNATFRATNFSHEQYNSFLWTGNAKAGLKVEPFNKILLVYGLADWTYTPTCACRWWENYLRWGVGTRLYLKPYDVRRRPTMELLRRIHIYAEYVQNGDWLGDSPENHVNKWDLRFGVGFSTTGYFRNEK